MKITDYYRLRILPENEGKKTVRFDTVASSGSYPLFENMAEKSKVSVPKSPKKKLGTSSG